MESVEKVIRPYSTILIVEDSQTQAEMLKRLLAEADYNVKVARDGAEGLKMAHELTPDLIISDISMPHMDGFALCKLLRESKQFETTPIILLTALSDVWDVIRGLNAGADNYLTKPYDPPLLLERVEDAISRGAFQDTQKFSVTVDVAGDRVTVEAGPQQLVNLLVSTYRNAISQNKLLQSTQDQLALLNLHLEDEVDRKSHDLVDKERALKLEIEKNLQRKEQHLKELRENLVDSVTALAQIVELRDPYTSGHQRRVADLAVAIATDMGLSGDDIDGLKIAGVVHDIGKIRVPVEILSKPGRLDDEEMALIKLHPEAGFQILKNIKFPWPIATIVQQHHEHEDGLGYPLGLKHGQILLSASIITVADVVDAMSFHRPYRAALGIERAIEEIKAWSGIRYDSRVVDACVRVIEMGLWKPGE